MTEVQSQNTQSISPSLTLVATVGIYTVSPTAHTSNRTVLLRGHGCLWAGMPLECSLKWRVGHDTFSHAEVKEFSPTHVPIMCAVPYIRPHIILCNPNQGLVLQISLASVNLFPLYTFLPQGIVIVMKPEWYTWMQIFPSAFQDIPY